MGNIYKITLSNKNLYKEIELSPEISRVKVGTNIDCDIRLHKELFFEPIELDFYKNNNNWTVICSDNLYLTTGNVRKLMTKQLVHGDTLDVRYHESGNSVFNLDFVIDFNNGQIKFEKAIDITQCQKITIGSSSLCNITINSEYAQKESIELLRKGSSLNLNIKDTQYGVYHNGVKTENSSEIKNGDFFSISDFFFYYKDEKIWTEIRNGLSVHNLNYYDYPEQNNYPKFVRNTRVKTVINTDKIEVLDPPAKPQKPKNNLILRLMPSLGMMLAAGVMAQFGGSMIIMSVISGCMAILTTILSISEGNKDYKSNIENRTAKYNSYIENKRAEIEEKRKEEQKNLNDAYLSQDDVIAHFDSFSSDLFDRASGDEDFLHVRLGTGALEAKRSVNFKKQEKIEVEDELQQIPEKLCSEYKYLPKAPIVCDFKSANAIGVVGNETQRFELLKNIVIDLAARQYHSDIKMIFVAEEENESKIHGLRMLPHVSCEEFNGRMIVSDNESKNLIFEHLYKELSYRKNSKSYPHHIVIFFYDEYGFKNHPISKFKDNAKDLGVTFVFFSESRSEIPQGCSYLIEAKDNRNAVLIDASNKNLSCEFEYPHISDKQAEKIVEILTPVYTEEISLEGSLTKNYSMFEMLNILAVDDLDLETRWNKSQVFKSMSAPIGISKTGIVNLDLHDKAHGPHGLVAGTTGSGKSEILQTYILAMSTLFHPYEVSFMIIDFKGGGMVNQFKDLPHLLGAITNIDGKEIDRSLKSIKAELQKRQRLFADADVNHIDKYIRKYKSKEVEIPLPHLIIIVDEFAELKAEQPEFMKELISAARIGRSLGVHLILATQKPSGQVNEQIWSNSRFKLCLKVQSQEDSNEVLKSPLAAEIKEPGRAYLQVGNNEIFELFQSAYSGASEKTDEGSLKEFTIFSMGNAGKKTPIYVQKKSKKEGGSTQLEAIVNYVHDYCERNNLKKLPNICLPPLNDELFIPDSLHNYAINSLPLGVYDDPDSQYQGYACFDVCEENTMIIGSSQTGKTNLLLSIIRLLADRYSPKEAVFYIADFGSMYLKNFEKLNHVGGVVTISETEKIKNLFKLLTAEIQNRKSIFMNLGLSSYSAYREAGYSDLPHIFLIVDNFSAFKEIYGEAHEDQFVYLTREGLSCGISVIITNGTTNGLGYRYISNFAARIAFNCNNSNEYINIFDRCRIQPKNVPGRALCKLNKELYEMQTFIAFNGEKEFERSKEIKKFIEQINSIYPNEKAKRIPSIPELLTFEYIEENYSIQANRCSYAIGLDYVNVDVVSLDLTKWNEFCVIGKDTNKKLKVTESILSAITRKVLFQPIKLYIVDSIERKLKQKSDLPYVERYTIDYSEIGTIFDEIIPILEKRYELLMDGEFEKLEKCSQIVLLINNRDAIEYISSSKDLLTTYSRILKQYKNLRVNFIFSDVEDSAVSYSGPELLKRFKESKKAIITSNLQEFKFCDLPSNAVRINKQVNIGDVFLLEGTDVTRIKLAEETKS